MNSEDDLSEAGEVEEQSEITFAWERMPRGKTQVQARHGGDLYHCHAFRLDDNKERAKFLREVASRALQQFGFEADPQALELSLLAIIEERADVEVQAEPAVPVEYLVVEGQDDPARDGFYAPGPDGPIQLSNFVARIERDITIVDGAERRRRFEGRVNLRGIDSPLAIDAADFGNPNKLVAAIFGAAGPRAMIYCRPEVLCRAISANSVPAARVASSDFGWTVAGDAYITPSVRVDGQGIHPVGSDDPLRVALEAEQCACHLDLAIPDAGELPELKRHVVEDLLNLHDRRVTFSLLAAVALGVLFRFVDGMNRPAVWMVGLTGGGKSFIAKLFQNFFGDFPGQLGSAFGGWTSTGNFLQRVGFFFKDAMFLIDDFKPDLTRLPEVLKLLQSYADGAARGRLRSDATTNVSREIRGILACTGEAVPDVSPSALARTVVVKVPARLKDIERGKRCLARRPRYRALMADFIRHLIAEGRGAAFAERVKQLQDAYYGPIAGVQNDLRIAGNLALLGAAFEEFAAYLADAGPEWERECRGFVETDLPAFRDEMVDAVKDQQPSEIFLATLRSLIEHKRVGISGWPSSGMDSGSRFLPAIGKAIPGQMEGAQAFEISTSLALEAVQTSLQKQGRPPLATTEKALLDQLAADGKLLDRAGRPLDARRPGRKTHGSIIDRKNRKVFLIAAGQLVMTEGCRGWSTVAPTGPPDD